MEGWKEAWQAHEARPMEGIPVLGPGYDLSPWALIEAGFLSPPPEIPAEPIS